LEYGKNPTTHHRTPTSPPLPPSPTSSRNSTVAHLHSHPVFASEVMELEDVYVVIDLEAADVLLPVDEAVAVDVVP